MRKISSAWLKTLSALCVNLSAGWFAAIVIVPNLAEFPKAGAFWTLTYDLFFGILFLWFSVKLEEALEKK